MKALEVTVSGSYKTANGDVIDFEDVKGIIPYVDEELAKMHVRRRYASEWVREAKDATDKKTYPNRIDRMRQVFVDDIQETNYDFSYLGKDIKKMSYEELQDLATVKDLRTVPLPKKTSGVDIREMREKVYLEYSAKVLKKIIDTKYPEPAYSSKQGNRVVFDFAKLPPLVVESPEARLETSKKMTNEEILDIEMKSRDLNSTPKDDLTLDDLKGIANQKGIEYHHKIGFDKLYNLLLGSGVSD